jgi:hypothetical protein
LKKNRKILQKLPYLLLLWLHLNRDLNSLVDSGATSGGHGNLHLHVLLYGGAQSHHGLPTELHHGLPTQLNHGLSPELHHGLPTQLHHGLRCKLHHGLLRELNHGLLRSSTAHQGLLTPGQGDQLATIHTPGTNTLQPLQ